MTTQRRAWIPRAGMALAAILGLMPLASPAGAAPTTPPALAAGQRADAQIQIISLDPRRLRSGKTATLTYQATLVVGSPRVRVETDSALACEGDCEVTLEPGENETYTARLTARDIPVGEVRPVRVAVISGGQRAEDQLTIFGPERAPSARRISGRIVDAETGEGVGGAQVGLKDSADHKQSTTADGSGRFAFFGSAQQPISPGQVQIGARADEYGSQIVTVRAADNGNVSGVLLRLRSTVRPTPSPTPTPTATQPSSDPTPADEPSDSAPGATTPASGDSSSPLFWIGVVVGLLVLALGIGGLILLLLRRRQENKDRGGATGPAAAPAGGSGAPYPPLGDATAIVNQPVAADPLANAQTVTQPAVRDEYADPYGLPPQVPGQPQYGAPPAWSAPAGYEGGGETRVGTLAPVGDSNTTTVGAGGYGFPPADPYGTGTTPVLGAPAPPYGAEAPRGDGFSAFGASGTFGTVPTQEHGPGGYPAPAGPDGTGGFPARGGTGGFPAQGHPDGYPAPGRAGEHSGGFPAQAAPGGYAVGSPTGGYPNANAESSFFGDAGYPSGGYPAAVPGGTGGYPNVVAPASAFSAFGAPAESAVPAQPGAADEPRASHPRGYGGPSPSPYFPAGAPAPTGESPRYDEPTGMFRPEGGAPVTPESYLSGLSQPSGDQPPQRRSTEWMDD
ncbi:hypothetical protein GCM10010123_19070 [Pilimelia anulata]|uniref:Carboxypeptidase regulatory-like domain-containing protein n=1 Tax=Pilimelia anulata TaxID=53371 RepID=A0A8J3F8T1_9ACTN|nr:carboxypeptidase regulatory-like domain-containing protein [Pilimelia anulata]GGJ89580.1 hypothetical protein GCM10010123_19070 [Pilimelia anulata]